MLITKAADQRAVFRFEKVQPSSNELAGCMDSRHGDADRVNGNGVRGEAYRRA
jgi:hypothetical protein